MYTILIIEDEPRVASLLMNGLEELQNICHDPAVKAKIRTLTEICEDGI